MDVRWARSARRHRIGKAHARFVMAGVEPERLPPDETHADEHWAWVGNDDRGIELEIEAVVLPNVLLVIHVMPTALRGRVP